eukprot:10788617-Ditylum_brightwellii.AAC.1
MAKFRSAPGCTITVLSDDESLADIEGKSAAIDQEEGIDPVNEVVDHLKHDHNTVPDTLQQEL